MVWDNQSPGWKESREQLCLTYWKPLYAYARIRGQSPTDAEDLTQAFLVKLLEGPGLNNHGPASGKFRSFLLTAFRRFMADEWRAAAAAKRGGNLNGFSFDLDQIESEVAALAEKASHSPETFFDRHWACSVIDTAIARVKESETAKGNELGFAVLRPFLNGNPKSTLKDVSAHLNLTHGAARAALNRLRIKFRQILREEIETTLGPGDDIDTELRYLIVCLRNPADSD